MKKIIKKIKKILKIKTRSDYEVVIGRVLFDKKGNRIGTKFYKEPGKISKSEITEDE